MRHAKHAAKAFGESLSLLFSRRFGTYWFSTLLANIGTWAQQVAEPWLLLSVGASSFLVGLDSFAMNAPVWALTLVGGMLADRADRRKVIALFQSIQMLCPLAIVFLLLTNRVRPWIVIATALVIGVTDALSIPSFRSIVPTIVPREKIARGIALNSMQWNLSRILGPAIAGVLTTSVGPVGCFALSAASYVPFIGVALLVLPPFVAKGSGSEASETKSASAAPEEESERRGLIDSVRSALREPNIRYVLLTALSTSTLCGPLVTFSPVIVKEVFHGDASRFSLVVSAFGAGGLLGALALLGTPLDGDGRRAASGFGAAYGAVLVLVSLNPWFWGLPALMACAGVALTVSNTASNAVLQSMASPRVLGQTVSLHMLAFRGGLSLGGLTLGLTIGAFGVRTALFVNGALAICAQAAIGRAWARARAFEARA